MPSMPPAPSPSSGSPSVFPGGRRPRTPQEYEERQIDANIERTAQANNFSFRAAMDRFREQIAATRTDVETRRSQGERVRDPYEGVTEEMLQDVTRQYAQSTEALKQDIRNLYVNAPTGAPPDSRWLQRQINRLNQEHTTAFNARIHEQYGAQGDAILQGVSGHTERPGMIDKFMSKLSTPGGLIGAIGLGAAAFMGMGGMGGGILAFGAALVAGLAGGALGGTVNNWITGRDNSRVQPAPPIPDIDAPGQNRGQEPAPGLVPGDLTPGASPTPPAPPTPGVVR